GKALFLRVYDGPNTLRCDLATGKKTRLPGYAEHGHATQGIAVSPDGKTVACADDSMIRLQDAETGEPALALPGHVGTVYWAFPSRDGRALPTGGKDETVRFWRGDSGRESRRVPMHRPAPLGLLAPDGNTLITADGDMVRFWDVAAGKLVH